MIPDIEANMLVKSIQSYKLLTGIRGNPPVDLKFVEENLLRLRGNVKIIGNWNKTNKFSHFN